MNAAQVRAKARMAMKRREEEIEQEEIEGGELNLVPYLDIVTNIMLFLLATVTSGMILGNINIGLPEASGEGGPTTNAADPAQEEKPPLDMVIVITSDKIRFFSSSGLEGDMANPYLVVPAVAGAKPGAEYEYGKLTEAATKLVVKYGWKDLLHVSEGPDGDTVCLDREKNQLLPMERCRPPAATEVLLAAGAEIPYRVVISVMDALRAGPHPDDAKRNMLLFPDVIFVTDLDTTYTE